MHPAATPEPACDSHPSTAEQPNPHVAAPAKAQTALGPVAVATAQLADSHWVARMAQLADGGVGSLVAAAVVVVDGVGARGPAAAQLLVGGPAAAAVVDAGVGAHVPVQRHSAEVLLLTLCQVRLQLLQDQWPLHVPACKGHLAPGTAALSAGAAVEELLAAGMWSLLLLAHLQCAARSLTSCGVLSVGICKGKQQKAPTM